VRISCRTSISNASILALRLIGSNFNSSGVKSYTFSFGFDFDIAAGTGVSKLEALGIGFFLWLCYILLKLGRIL